MDDFHYPLNGYLFFSLFGNQALATDSFEVVNKISIEAFPGLGASVLIADDYNDDGIKEYIAAGVGFIVLYDGASGEKLTKIYSDVSDLWSTEQFGVPTVNIGDLDKDGYDDIAICAHTDGADYSERGSVHIIDGHCMVESSPSRSGCLIKKLVGGHDNVRFGTDVSSADLNQDGTLDLIVGAEFEYHPVEEDYFGGVHIFSGVDLVDPAKTQSDALVRLIYAEEYYSLFGESVLGVNEMITGNPGLVVGASEYYGAGNTLGAVYIYDGPCLFNSANSDTDCLVRKLEGTADNQTLGKQLSKLKDINSDTVSEIAVASVPQFTDLGKVELFDGACLGDSTRPLSECLIKSINGENGGDGFGFSVSDVGDLDNDGSNDLAILNNTSSSSLYLYSGGILNDDEKTVSEALFSSLSVEGYSVAGIEDINSDGFTDLLLGIPDDKEYIDTGDGGKLYFLSGAAITSDQSLETATIKTFDGADAYTRFGIYVGSADISGDGIDEIMVGSYLDPAIHIFSASCLMASPDSEMCVQRVLTDVYRPSSPGDLNGDGKDEVFAATKTSQFHIYDGACLNSQSAHADCLLINTGNTAEEFQIKAGVEFADLNQDNVLDIITGTNSTNMLYVYDGACVGGDNPTPAACALRNGADFGLSMVGNVISAKNDITNDSINDLIIGIYPANSYDGAFLAIDGACIADSQQSAAACVLAQYTGENADDRFGIDLDFIDDLNNDGIPDVIVGAIFSDAVGSNSGSAYIFSGSCIAAGGSFATCKFRQLLGQQSSDGYGYTTRRIYDLDGDGIDEFVVAKYAEPGAMEVYSGACIADNSNSQADCLLHLFSDPPQGGGIGWGFHLMEKTYDKPIVLAGAQHSYEGGVIEAGAVFLLTDNEDSDGDTIIDSLDNCASSANADQANTDSDIAGNLCDCDPNDSLVWQNAYLDTDEDGVRDSASLVCVGPLDGYTKNASGLDNCPDTYNPDQEDQNNDGIGDVCQPDSVRC